MSHVGRGGGVAEKDRYIIAKRKQEEFHIVKGDPPGRRDTERKLLANREFQSENPSSILSLGDRNDTCQQGTHREVKLSPVDVQTHW